MQHFRSIGWDCVTCRVHHRCGCIRQRQSLTMRGFHDTLTSGVVHVGSQPLGQSMPDSVVTPLWSIERDTGSQHETRLKSLASLIGTSRARVDGWSVRSTVASFFHTLMSQSVELHLFEREALLDGVSGQVDFATTDRDLWVVEATA
ncbi:MAG: hypothetical protein ACK528_12835 [Alphaproteobacteria bacterium]